jgi:hypothetical protein
VRDQGGNILIYSANVSISSSDVRALELHPRLVDRAASALNGTDDGTLSGVLDDLVRHALVASWPLLLLVIIDEIHGLTFNLNAILIPY